VQYSAASLKVEFRVPVALDQVPDGPVDIVVRCTDLAGNTAVAHCLALKDSSGPSIAILAPRTADSLSGAFLFAATVSDDGALSRVEMSTDGLTFAPMTGGALFTSVIDPAGLPGAPEKITVRATDRAGNVSTSEVALRGSATGAAGAAAAKDTEKPTIEILSPAKGARIHGRVLFVGRAADNAGLKKVSWDSGTGKKGDVELRQGSPSWLAEIDFSADKAGTPTVVFTAEDTSGNKAEIRYAATVDPASDQPALTILQPGVRTAVGAPVLVSVLARDPDGMGSAYMAVDAGAETELAAGSAFAAALDGIAPGAHKLIVRAVDANGLSSQKYTVDFTVVGPGPAIIVEAAAVAKQPVAFTPGMRLPVSATSLTGTVALTGTPRSAEYAFNAGSLKQVSTRASARPGAVSFDVPLPPDLPFGRTDVKITVMDTSGRRSEAHAVFYRVADDPGTISDAEGVVFVDARLGTGGPALLAPADTLAGFFNGRPVASVSTDPATPVLEAGFDGNFVVLRAATEGHSGSVRVKVSTVDGDTFLSEPLSVNVDAGAPALALETPRTGDWVGATLKLKGTASDPNGVTAVEYSLGATDTFTPVTTTAANGVISFDAVVDLSAAADGDVPLAVRATDGAGRVRIMRLAVMKDTTAPTLSLVTPLPADPVNGLITVTGTARDEGTLDRVEFSVDGKAWNPVEGTSSFRMALDLSKLPSPAGSLAFRAWDRSGNTADLVPSLNVQQAADIPEVQIQVPPEGEVQRGDFSVSGMVFDDDGVGSISWRIDGGEFTTLPGANRFSIPFSLFQVGDNEHTVEVKAQDINGVESAPRAAVVRVSRAEPVSKLAAPSLSSTSRGVVTLSGEATDANGIASVWLSFDNGHTWERGEGKEKWTYRLDTRLLKDGTYSLFIRAVDAYGTEGLGSTLLSVDNTPPQVVLDAPGDAAVVAGTLTIAGRADDSISLASLAATLNPVGRAGQPIARDLPRTGAFSAALDLSGAGPGLYDLAVQGMDKASNITVVTRLVKVQARAAADSLDIWFPLNGEDLHGSLTLAGRLVSATPTTEAMLVIDGKDAGAVALGRGGWFSTRLAGDALPDGSHTLAVRAALPDGTNVSAEPRSVTFSTAGPWVRIASNGLGDFVRARPFIKGTAGWVSAEAGPAPRPAADPHRVTRVEVSLDNGKSFLPAQGREQWQYRLESADLPDGPVRFMVRAVFADGSLAVDRTIVVLDDTTPTVVLLTPKAGSRFNDAIPLTGTASDENGIATVRVAVRAGDKAAYEVPSFIQGLYFDAHVLGATAWEAGAGLTFFNNNVKLQALVGMAPDGRFSGLTLGAKLLANIARLPFGYMLGPDWDFLSGSLAVGADFSYVTNSGTTIAFTDKGLILGAVVAQLEFPVVKIASWPVFNTWSTYAEYQLWFISSDVSAGFASRLAFGARVGLF
jgi:hypothetical protein